VPQLLVVKRSQLIAPPHPIRVAMDEQKIEELAASIRRYGIVLPLAVCVIEFDTDHELSRQLQIAERKEGLKAARYEIIDGHRRYVASGMAGLSDIPVSVFDSVEDAKWGMMLDANIMREDITAAEEGIQFLQIAELRGWGVERIMEHFGKSEDYINQRVTLVQNYPDLVTVVNERRINWTQAKAIMRCTDPNHRAYLIDQADTHGASARALIYMVDQWKSQQQMNIGGVAVHTPEHGQPAVVQANPKCLWCDRDDDPANIIDVKVHSYHKRDLEAFLDQVGVNRPARVS
jgi:ParB family chromosome partitioning protein